MFWFRRKYVPYVALSEGEADPSGEADALIDDKQENYSDSGDETSEQKVSKVTAALTAFIIVLSIANITFFVHQYASQVHLHLPVTPDSALELASSYIGFDRIHDFGHGSAHFNYTIENMPLDVGSVDREHPSAVRPVELPHWQTFRGLVIPDRRHIIVNETISTIVQFRAQDFGLEVCRPVIELSSYASLINSTIKSGNDNKMRTFDFSAPSVLVQVWALQTVSSEGREVEIDFSRLTFANRPQRKAYLGVVDVREGVRVAADAFACKSGSLHALELSCDSPNCALDFWADTEQPKMAFFVEQSSL